MDEKWIIHNRKMATLATRSRALTISDRAYRILLAAYPAAFRRRYGPEMAQVFRTCCRLAYRASGASGVLRLWLPALWDWARSAVGEWFSSIFRRSKVYSIYARRASSPLIPMLFLLNACLICLCVNPCTWVFGDPLFGDGEGVCGFEVENQSGKTLRVTPIDSDRIPFSPVRLYRNTFPPLSAYQQRDVIVKSGDIVRISFDCSQGRMSELLACDLEGECYIHQHPWVLQSFVRGAEVIISGARFRFTSLDSLSRPDAALVAAVESFPEHDYTGLKTILLCSTVILFIIGGVFWLVRSRVVEMPKHDI